MPIETITKEELQKRIERKMWTPDTRRVYMEEKKAQYKPGDLLLEKGRNTTTKYFIMGYAVSKPWWAPGYQKHYIVKSTYNPTVTPSYKSSLYMHYVSFTDFHAKKLTKSLNSILRVI